jgi:hypothetical protein
MRKVLSALASGALVLTLAAPAWAAPARPQSHGNQSRVERDCHRNHWGGDSRDQGRWGWNHRGGDYHHGFCR